MSNKKIKLSFSQFDIDQLQDAITFDKKEKVFQWSFNEVTIDIYAEN